LLRRNSTSYIELYQGENPENKFQERLRHIYQLRKKHSVRSSTSDFTPIESESDNSGGEEDRPSVVFPLSVSPLTLSPKINCQAAVDDDAEETHNEGLTKSSQFNEYQDLDTIQTSSQSLYEDKHQKLEAKHSDMEKNESSHQNVHQSVKTNGYLSHKHDHSDVNHNANKNNTDSVAIGERVMVNHKERYLFGFVRYIGHLPSKKSEQIGIELDKPMGKISYIVWCETFLEV